MVEVTQKAHSALRWLINRQGYIKGDLAIVAWSINGEKIPNPMDDPISILLDDVSSTDLVADTALSLAIRFNKRISGYGKELGDTSTIVVLGLDSANLGEWQLYITGNDRFDFL
jgi:CRISPR-associated protein Csd1